MCWVSKTSWQGREPHSDSGYEKDKQYMVVFISFELDNTTLWFQGYETHKHSMIEMFLIESKLELPSTGCGCLCLLSLSPDLFS